MLLQSFQRNILLIELSAINLKLSQTTLCSFAKIYCTDKVPTPKKPTTKKFNENLTEVSSADPVCT